MERISTADPVTNAAPKLPTSNVPSISYGSGPGLQGQLRTGSGGERGADPLSG